DTRHLTSFPTRRSSDLLDFLGGDLAFKVDHDLFLGYVDRPGIRPAPYLARAYWVSMSARQLPLGNDELRQLLTRSHQLVVRRLRSEEHTSELQSRENLV